MNTFAQRFFIMSLSKLFLLFFILGLSSCDYSTRIDTKAAKLQDGRMVMDQQSLIERPEMQEIYKQMLALIKSQSLD